MRDIIVIGAGTAGLTAALYARRAGKTALVLESENFGGQITYSPRVENYPGISRISGNEFANALFEQVMELGAELEMERVTALLPANAEEGPGERAGDRAGAAAGAGIGADPGAGIGAAADAGAGGSGPGGADAGEGKPVAALGALTSESAPCWRVVTEDGSHLAAAVIIATGAKHRTLGLPGEEELIGEGVSYCALCDGAFYRDKVVAVVGGGDTALQDALFLAGGCAKVYLIHRRDTFRGEARWVELLRNAPNVEFILDTVVTGLEAGNEDFAEASAGLTALWLENRRVGEKRRLPVDGLFVAVGQAPANEVFAGLLPLDGAGYIIAGEDCRTPAPGVFAAGDCRAKEVRQLTTAAADGAVAATAACRWTDERR